MITDIHNHSSHSSDGSVSVGEMCAAAVKKGIDVFAITDHFEANQWGKEDYAAALTASFADIEAEKPLTALKLCSGVELGQPLEGPEAARWLLSGMKWDFVIGSLHNTMGDPDFYYMNYAAMTDDEIFFSFKKYYRELLDLAEEGDFDSLGHITYPYRYLNEARRKREILVRPESFDADAEAVLAALIRRGKALELNTGSILRTEADRELNARYFKLYRELGGELVTIGSDAHAPDRVGSGWEAACGILRDAGLLHVAFYENRQPVQVSWN